MRRILPALMLLSCVSLASAQENKDPKPGVKEFIDASIEKLKAKGGFAAQITHEDEEPPKELRKQVIDDAVFASPDQFMMSLPCSVAQKNPRLYVNGGRVVTMSPFSEEWCTGQKILELPIPLNLMVGMVSRVRPHAILDRMQQLAASANFRAEESVGETPCRAVEVILVNEAGQLQWLWQDKLAEHKILHKGKLDASRLDEEKCATTYIVWSGRDDGLPRRVQVTTKLVLRGKGAYSNTRTCTYDLSHFGEGQKIDPPDEARKLLGMK